MLNIVGVMGVYVMLWVEIMCIEPAKEAFIVCVNVVLFITSLLIFYL